MTKDVEDGQIKLEENGRNKDIEDEPFRRKNVFYRSIERLRRMRARKETTSADSTGEVFEDEMFYKNKTPDPKRDRSKVSKTQYGSQRKGSAPGDIRANKQRNSDADKPIKRKENGEKMTRPFSLFSKKVECPKPSASPKPDFFKDVVLKKTVTEIKLVPKTTERYKLFEGVYQVSLEVDETSGKLKPVVSWSHPPLGTTKCRNIQATEKSVPDFAFPDLDLLEAKSARSVTETYAFVQTDMSAARIIGYCRRFKYKETAASRLRSGTEASVSQSANGSGHKLTKVQKKLLNIRVWCIVTKLHCFETFSAIFDKIHTIRREATSNADSEVFSFLKSVWEGAAPLPGNTVKMQYVSKLITDDNSMGSYDIKRPGPEDRVNLLKHADLLNSLPKNILITVMIALFTESKVLFLDKTLSSLTTTLHALTSLLYPLNWVCIYIPMLSVGVRDVARDLVLSPSPYVIGMLKNDYFKVRENELKDTSVLVVDLTKKKLSDLRDKEATQLPISEATRKRLKQKLREIRQKKDDDQLKKQSEVWGEFIQPFLSCVNEVLADSTEVKDGYRQMDISAYKNKIKSTMDGDEIFAEQLFNSQMSQMWLQKQKISISR